MLYYFLSGNDYLKRAEGNNAQGLSANLKALKQRWEAVQGRANDKKIKLEIALKEATEFHNALQVISVILLEYIKKY